MVTAEKPSRHADEDNAVFTYSIDNNAVCIGWACDAPEVQAALIETAAQGYVGRTGSEAVQARVSECLLHAIEAIEKADDLDPFAQLLAGKILSEVLQNDRIVESIGNLAENAAKERDAESVIV
jgi:hypothetical protein